jgi:hypothetical protein
MRSGILIALPVVLLAAPALAHGPFDGRWGLDVEACSLDPGTSHLVPTEIHGQEVQYYESRCTIDDLVPIGGEGSSAWRVKLTCSGEGETWQSDSLFAIDYGNQQQRPQWIDIDMETGSVVVRQYCDWPQN